MPEECFIVVPHPTLYLHSLSKIGYPIWCSSIRDAMTFQDNQQAGEMMNYLYGINRADGAGCSTAVKLSEQGLYRA
jgi:hypothetical protein